MSVECACDLPEPCSSLSWMQVIPVLKHILNCSGWGDLLFSEGRPLSCSAMQCLEVVPGCPLVCSWFESM